MGQPYNAHSQKCTIITIINYTCIKSTADRQTDRRFLNESSILFAEKKTESNKNQMTGIYT